MGQTHIELLQGLEAARRRALTQEDAYILLGHSWPRERAQGRCIWPGQDLTYPGHISRSTDSGVWRGVVRADYPPLRLSPLTLDMQYVWWPNWEQTSRKSNP